MIPIRDTAPRARRPWVNYLLVGVNVAVFLYELSLGPALDPFIRHQALVPARELGWLAAGAPLWRVALPVVVSMFLHGGWFHLGGNMLYLWIFGDNVEDALGHGGYLLFYFGCGFAAAAGHLLFNAGSVVPVVGASGAIAGVLGAYLVMFPKSRVLTLVPIFFFFTFVEIPAPFFLVFWFAIQFVSGTLEITHATARAVSGTGGIAWFAHLAGFVCGVGVGLALWLRHRHRRARRFMGGA